MRLRPELVLLDIPKKANRILQLILIIMVGLALRIGYLSSTQHETARQEAFRGRKKASFETAPRGTIRDCFNNLLATNSTEFEVRITWAQLQVIGNRGLRKKYVKALSTQLGKILKSNPRDIEDTLYSFAALNPQIPYVVQRGINEKQYYAIRSIEHLYPGLEAVPVYRRVYPKGKSACHVLGYTSSIQKQDYDRLLLKRHRLERSIKMQEEGIDPEDEQETLDYTETKKQLEKLTRQAYTLLDRVGRAGIEASYEENLRGKRGMNRYFANAQGRPIRSLSGQLTPLPGDRVVLTISSELQEHCEKLLTESDSDRRQLFHQEVISQKPYLMNPYQRGGAIIALDPKTGQVRALASFPRFDPNDFSPSPLKLQGSSTTYDQSASRLQQWLLQPGFIEKLWNQEVPYLHERFDAKQGLIITEEISLTWDFFLNLVLPKDSILKKILSENREILELIRVQQALFKLSELSSLEPDEVLFHLYSESKNNELTPLISSGTGKKYKADIDALIGDLTNHDERILCIDLMRLIIRIEEITAEEIPHLRNMSIGQFRSSVCICNKLCRDFRKKAFDIFWDVSFRKWREINEAQLLKEVRVQERLHKKRPQPFLTILRNEAQKQFNTSWDLHWKEWFTQYVSYQKPAQINANNSDPNKLQPTKIGPEAIYPSLIPLYIRSARTDFPLLGQYASMAKFNDIITGLSLLSSLNRVLLPASSSFAFQHATPQGSIFKLAVAYAALLQRDRECNGSYTSSDTRFFELTDLTYKAHNKQFVGYLSDGKPLPQIYKGGRIPKSSHPDFGKLDLIKAIAVSSNPYFSLLASEYLETPSSLEQASMLFGYGTKTGIDLPYEIKGNIPSDLETNKTGLYTTAIGQHTLLCSPLQTAVMISALSNGGKVITPKVVQKLIAMDARDGNKQLPRADSLELLGIPPSFFIETRPKLKQIQVEDRDELIQREIELPSEVQKCLYKGMREAVHRITDNSRSTFRRRLHSHPEWEKALERIVPHFIGKTSTAEVREKFGLQQESHPFLYNHIWFGGIYFDTNESTLKAHMIETPELVVVVYLRYGSYGKEALPIAASVVDKWLQIREKHCYGSVLSGK